MKRKPTKDKDPCFEINIGRLFGIALALENFTPKDDNETKEFLKKCAIHIEVCAKNIIESRNK